MLDSSDLFTLRAELKRKLTDGTCDPLPERIIKSTRRMFPRLPQGDLAPFIVLNLGYFLLASLLHLFDGVEVLQRWAAITFSNSVIIWLGHFLYARLFRQLYHALSGYVIDAITQPKDIRDLNRWLSRIGNTPLTVVFAASFLPFITPYIISTLLGSGKFGVGGMILITVTNLIQCIILYPLISLMLFPLILSRYQIDLYELDPGMSPSIRHLSIVIRNSSYQLSVYATGYTLYIVYVLRLPAFPIAFTYLIPLIGIFIFRQVGFSIIVARARRVVLERLRAGMENLDIERHFDNPAICNQYKAMLDYYNRVKNAEPGVFDARTGLLLVNSFLLPTVAFVLFQFDRIVAFIGRFIS